MLLSGKRDQRYCLHHYPHVLIGQTGNCNGSIIIAGTEDEAILRACVRTETYTFDDMGNRLTKTDNVNGNDTYTYNNANMLLTRNSGAYTNDANGNTITGGGRANTWDSQNRMAQCVQGTTTSTFTYGSDGIRHRTTVQTGQGAPVTTDAVLDNSNLRQKA